MDVSFQLLGFPVRAQVWFLLTAWFIGPRSGPPHEQLLWVALVAVGVLIHELGHALMARRAGFSPQIVLHGFGGQTSWVPTRRLKRAGEMAITAAGPAVGIAVGSALLVASWWLPLEAGSLLWQVLRWSVWINLGWGLLNLLPINPLDGGRLIVLLAAAVWPEWGPTVARLVSLGVAAALAVWAFLSGLIWTVIILAVLILGNVQELRQAFAPRRHDREGTEL